MLDRPCPRSLAGRGAPAPAPGAAALFLDRDGVINRDHGYVHRPEDFDWMPGVFDLARAASQAGMPLVVVTNQAGIARGYYDEAAFAALTQWMCQRFESEGAPLSRVYFCPHHTEGSVALYRRPCDCRKPRPGMLSAAAQDLHLDLSRSLLVGDKASDMQAGQAAGVGTLALLGDDPLPPGLGPVHRLADLQSALTLLPRVPA